MSGRSATAAAMIVVVSIAATGGAAAQENAPDPSDRKAALIELLKEALAADKEGRLEECVAKQREAIALLEQATSQLHLASCLGRLGRIAEALRAAKRAHALAIEEGNEKVEAVAQRRIDELAARVAYVVLRMKVPGAKVEIDGVPVRERDLSARITLLPGYHRIEGSAGKCGEFKHQFELREGEVAVFDVNDCGIDHPRVGPPREPRVNALLGLEMSAYTDTNGVNVLTPAVSAMVASERGWHVAGSYLVDAISAASPDTVSTASPRFHETRHQVIGEGGYKHGIIGAQLRSKVSTEPDCLSVTAGGTVSVDLEDRLLTPRIGYAHREDRIGVRGTPFSEFERRLAVNDFELGANIEVSPATMLVTAATLETMRGDPSNPYRYIPLFAAEVAPSISRGASGDLVNVARLPLRPREQLPTERDRFALAARIQHRFDYATLRIEERAYVDTWGIKASTTDARYIRDVGQRLRVGPHLRFHGQSGASFYQLAYVAAADAAQGTSAIPLYRTTARELSPMVALTAGGSARVLLNGEDASARFSLILSSDVTHAHYFESLFVTTRTALYGTVAFEAEL